MRCYKKWMYTSEEIPRSTRCRYKRRRERDRIKNQIGADTAYFPARYSPLRQSTPNVPASAEIAEPLVAQSTPAFHQLQLAGLQNSNPTLVTENGNDGAENSKLTTEREEAADHSTLATEIVHGTDSTVADIYLMVLALGLRHNLTWEAQVDILKLVNCVCSGPESEASFHATKHHYLKFLGGDEGSISCHVTCNECEAYLGKKEDLEEGTIECPECEKPLVLSNCNIFISLSLESQIRKLLENEEVANAILTYRHNRIKDDPFALEDIFDGREYQKHCVDGGILQSPQNFSYNFNTDGVPVGKSSRQTLWPIYITINELPPEMRKKHILLAGLYVGPKDPDQTIFMQPFVSQANHLSTNGFQWRHKGEIIFSKVIPLCGVVDSVARYQCMGMMSFHAKFGCTFCYQESERTSRGQRYLAIKSNSVRSQESTLEDLVNLQQLQSETAENRAQKVTAVRGVKAPSPFLSMFYFSLITGFVVDYMHNILLGCVKFHTDLIFQSTRKKFWMGMNDQIGMEHLKQVITEKLLSIKPPKSITRTPRGIDDMASWKASEWRSWLLFYAVPCMKNYLKPKHVDHLAMLSVATHLLLKKSINLDDVYCAEQLLLSYIFYFQKYFKEENMTYNVHLLSHIVSGVRNWGPLWTHNAFIYEGENRHLLQKLKSPTNITIQIGRKFLMYSSYLLRFSCLNSSSKTQLFCEEVSKNNRRKKGRPIGNVRVLGKGNISSCGVVLTDEERLCLNHNCIAQCDITTYPRMVFQGQTFSTAHYVKEKKNNDSYFYSRDCKVFSISKILHIEDNATLLVRTVSTADTAITLLFGTIPSHIQRVTGIGEVQCVTPAVISDQCIALKFADATFVAKIPFGCYGD